MALSFSNNRSPAVGGEVVELEVAHNNVSGGVITTIYHLFTLKSALENSQAEVDAA